MVVMFLTSYDGMVQWRFQGHGHGLSVWEWWSGKQRVCIGLALGCFLYNTCV